VAGIGAPFAAGRADEAVLNVGNPDVIGPLARVHLDRMAALVVGAIDQDVIDARLPHFSESDFLLAGEGGHVPMIPSIGHGWSRPGIYKGGRYGCDGCYMSVR
jgi:hypothetical protein